MSEWLIEREEKKKVSAQISMDSFLSLESMKEFISSESGGLEVSDSQALDLVIKIASKNSAFKKFLKSKK